MITVRKSNDRGHLNHGWLDTSHTFSFGEYRDPDHRGFRSLRVINEDTVAARTGFAEHPHHDMEIITYPLSGALRHGDSLGHQEDIGHGTIQTMTAGGGIRHSEYNPHAEPVHLLQIWILPKARGLAPSHDSRSFPIADQPGRFHQIVSPDGADNSLVIQQDARLHAGIFARGHAETVALGPGRHAWIQVARGSLTVNGVALHAGDGAAISDETSLELRFTDDSEVLVFDLN
jgi:redox-sensitive bicupin YhaK (pirin superfamily)